MEENGMSHRVEFGYYQRADHQRKDKSHIVWQKTAHISS